MNLIIRNEAGVCTIVFQGKIDAGLGADLKKLNDKLTQKRIQIDLGAVYAINSIGSVEWIRWIEPLASSHIVELVNCPVSFIDYANVMPTMLGAPGLGSSVLVKTFRAPYVCRRCQVESERLVALEDVTATRSLPTYSCDACQEALRSEVESEDYLVFLERTL